jgi:hypothetical protein
VDDLILAGVVVPFIVAMVCTGVCLAFSQKKDAQLSLRSPGTLSYKWGYFLGYSGLMAAVGGIGGGIVMTRIGFYPAWAPFVMVYSVAFGVASYGVLIRRRWGWIFHIPLSMNMGLWAFNSVYFFNRWKELGTDS